ncbi:hypothetical protein D3C75_719400 [compost metagenome]
MREFLYLVGLSGKRFDGPHTGDILLDSRCQRAERKPHLLKGRMNLGFKSECDSSQKRHRDQCDQRKLPIDREHHNGAEQHHKKHIQQLGKSETDEHPDSLKVPGQPGHQVTCLGGIIIPERQELQFLIAGITQPVGQKVAQASSEKAVCELQTGFDEHYRQYAESEYGHLSKPQGNNNLINQTS